MRLLLTLGLLKRGELALGQHQALLGDLRLERLEPLLHGLKLMALPHAAHAGGRDRVAALADLVGDPDLAEGGLLKRQSKDQRLNLGRRAVGQKRLAPRQLLKRQLASGLVEILEAIEAVARVAHHLAGLAHVAELPSELQQANLGPDDLLFLGHDQLSSRTPRPGAAHPDHSAPGLGSRFSLMTPSVRSSVDYCKDVDHSRTKTKSPQTNGIVERFHKTVLNEFYRVAFRKRIYGSIAWIRKRRRCRPGLVLGARLTQ